MSDKSSLLFPATLLGTGDIHSGERGTGARYNKGKPPMELMPIRMIAALYDNTELRAEGDEAKDSAVAALYCLANFQERRGRDVQALLGAMQVLGFAGVAECASVFGYGAKKYLSWNWAKGMPWSVPLACAVRHLIAILDGESNDPESGEPHRGHVYCNLAMLFTYLSTYPEGDDRPGEGLLAPLPRSEVSYPPEATDLGPLEVGD